MRRVPGQVERVRVGARQARLGRGGRADDAQRKYRRVAARRVAHRACIVQRRLLLNLCRQNTHQEQFAVKTLHELSLSAI